MTSPTNGASRIVEHVEGVVQGANERGIHLVGEQDWRNFSKWTAEPIAPPARGASVRLGLDASGFVRTVEILSTNIPATADRGRTITRLTVLKAAANFVGLWGQNREDVRSDHVLVLANKWLAWVDQDDEDDDRP